MLKANIKTPIGPFVVEGATQLEVFEAVAQIQEVFSEESCGLCGCESIRYAVREVGGNTFPEIHCQNSECEARLTFGQNRAPKVGSIYPVRKLEKSGKPNRTKGVIGEHRGWTKYRGEPSSD